MSGSYSAAIPPGMQRIIRKHSLALGGVGVVGAFGAHADIPAITGSWAVMLTELATEANIKLDMEGALKITAALATAVGGVWTGFKLANSYFAYTGVGTPLAVLANACGLSLNEVAEANVAKLRARYPSGFDANLSQNRKAGDV